MASTGRTLGVKTRLGLVALALVCGAVFGLARWLRPDPRGYGTHTQLGLLPCGFRMMTGMPCPSCGMTTAFAWGARGKWHSAWKANPAATLLMPAVALTAIWLVVSAAIGRPWLTRTLDGPLMTAVVFSVAVTLIGWSLQLFTTFFFR